MSIETYKQEITSAILAGDTHKARELLSLNNEIGKCYGYRLDQYTMDCFLEACTIEEAIAYV